MGHMGLYDLGIIGLSIYRLGHKGQNSNINKAKAMHLGSLVYIRPKQCICSDEALILHTFKDKILDCSHGSKHRALW
jgi:hypothetical protein